MHTTRAVAIGMLAVALLAAACADDDEGDDSGGAGGDETTTTTEPGTTTTAEPSPEEQAIAVYQAGQDYVSRALAAQPPSPDDPALEQYFAGQELTDVIDNLVTANQNNEYWETELELHPEVASATSEQVLLSDCATETYRRLDVSSGDVKDQGTQLYNFRVEVTLEPAGWRVSEIENREDPCETPA
jgi:hypothetical protein